jgi:hypothetical protein
MWHGETFINYLDQTFGEQAWEVEVYPKVVELIRSTLK